METASTTSSRTRSWGTWHTSREILQRCPQGCPTYHTIDQAVELNAKIREFNQAKMHARTKEWLGAAGI